MTEIKQNIPKLRFPEFSGEWAEKSLGDVSCNIDYGMNSAAGAFDGENKYIRITDIDDESRTYKAVVPVSPSETPEEKYYLKKGDIAFARTGASVGKSYLYKENDGKLCFAGFLIRFHINKANPYFIYSTTLQNSYIKWVKIMSMRSGQPGINAEEYKTYKFHLPNTSHEQQKIADFLTRIDNRIEKLQEKKSLLETYKKGVMQKIFTQKIRFKDENGNNYPDWEFLGSGDIFGNVSNKKHNSNLPILAITQEFGAIPRELIDYNISVTEKSVEGYKVVEKGDFIISLRSFQGGIEYSNYKGICSPAYIILRSKKEISDQFFKHYLKTNKYINSLNSKLEGIRDGKMISYKYFSEIKLPFPTILEQQKIANFLISIDKKIENIQTQIEQSQAFKKGLLQQMFV